MNRIVSKYTKRLHFVRVFYKRVAAGTKAIWGNLLRLIDKKPLMTFFSLLGILLALIILGNFLHQPKPEKTVAVPPKVVSVFSIGENPRVQVSAKIEKSGAITLIAQTSGIIWGINKFEGAHIGKGESLFSLSSTYQGGSLPTISRQIAERNAAFVVSTYEAQKQTIAKRRDLANSTDTQTDKLRNITNESLDETRNLISLNEEIVSSLDSQIQSLEATNVGGSNDSLILQTKQAKSGVLTGLNALKSGLRASEYQGSGDQEPAHLSDVSRELTNQQLDLEEKSLALNREISLLSYKVALISESLMYPASPVNGIIERIHVHIGDSVNPGTVLATITGDKTSANAVALVSSEVARNLSRIEQSRIFVGGQTVEVTPRYISKEPTDGSLHSVLFTLPQKEAGEVSDGSYVQVEIPVSKPSSTASVPFIPLDAIYQTQNEAYVFIASPSGTGTFTVESKTVTLGTVVGSFVQVNSGLNSADQVITNRNVIAGDRVTVQ